MIGRAFGARLVNGGTRKGKGCHCPTDPRVQAVNFNQKDLVAVDPLLFLTF